jgi:hypothetical protein
MIEKLALLRMAFCSARVFSNAISSAGPVTTLIGFAPPAIGISLKTSISELRRNLIEI